MGAIASGGILVVNEAMPHWLAQSSALEHESRIELAELQRRESLYRAARTPVSMVDRTVILVDDGAATGSSMLAAVRAVRQRGAREVIVALPVAARDTSEKLRAAADRLICVHTPEAFAAVGSWYRDFDQTSDQQVCTLLERSSQGFSAQRRANPPQRQPR
jgi:predicted phosphoribosyltransferase